MSAPRTVAIMQPYFLPYLGYWQLIRAADLFVVYDDVEYTKKGWINRNRMLRDGRDETFSLPLKKDSDFLDVRDRRLADGFDDERHKLLRRFEAAYRKAPYREATLELVRRCLMCEERNLFGFLHHSIEAVCRHLGLETSVVASSGLGVDRALKGQERVIATCRALGVSRYLNPGGGVALYDRDAFREHGIELAFQRVAPYRYPQFGAPFVPHLSIVDVLMFNDRAVVERLLGAMELA